MQGRQWARTIREVWHIDAEGALQRVGVGEEAIVHELPAEGVGDDDDGAFDGRAFWWSGKVCWAIVDRLDDADGSSVGAEPAAEAGGTGHGRSI